MGGDPQGARGWLRQRLPLSRGSPGVRSRQKLRGRSPRPLCPPGDQLSPESRVPAPVAGRVCQARAGASRTRLPWRGRSSEGQRAKHQASGAKGTEARGARPCGPSAPAPTSQDTPSSQVWQSSLGVTELGWCAASRRDSGSRGDPWPRPATSQLAPDPEAAAGLGRGRGAGRGPGLLTRPERGCYLHVPALRTALAAAAAGGRA